MEYALDFIRLFLIDLFYAGPLLLLLVALIALMGYFIGRIEGWSRSDAMYHAFINATTVGYGDLHPTKGLSKILAIMNAFVGILFVGIVVAIDLHAAVHAFSKVYESNEMIDYLCK
jgi:voltage-gated potassium channel